MVSCEQQNFRERQILIAPQIHRYRLPASEKAHTKITKQTHFMAGLASGLLFSIVNRSGFAARSTAPVAKRPPPRYIPVMLLAIDIGNTNVVYGAFDGPVLKADFRITTSARITPDEAGLSVTHFLMRAGIELTSVDKVVIGSVVPHLTSVFEQTCRKYLKREPIVVRHTIKLPVKIDIDFPDQVGADRIANAAAGFARYGGPLIVVDFGTATTFDVVNTDGAYIGGVIIAGPETAMAELARRAARLYEVRIEQPERVVGRSTSGALQSGAFYGLLGQVDFIIERIIEEQDFANCRVVATGGLAYGIEQHSRFISEVVPSLTLEGLRIIGEGN